ncbi:hypothetical protein MOQ72_35275 [Saccharopolyspora sp. K220]|uniref:hypothetical protein n=1 Tax=Saccharopolyspora soli TaxID=2926618 RepID=UPI001F5758AE|nr:hypothetical protein [Saccharopolyspora soli]MCI2422701.1 hypothetical protein [Saccharopolyspora soli]
MDQKSLQSSSRRWMQAAFEAFGRGESLDFAVHHAGVGLEHLLKAYLCSLHPALIIEATHWASLLHAVGHGDRSGVPASRTKSIGLKVAFDRTRALLKPKITVADPAFERVFAARNGVAHVGTHDADAARAVLGTCIRIATPVLAELEIDLERYWGHYTALVDKLADERNNELRVTFEAKIARAKRAFQQRFDDLPSPQRESVVAAFGATRSVYTGYDVSIGCPACEGTGWVHSTDGAVVDWRNATENEAGESVPAVTIYASAFSCAVCGLELEGDELDLADLEKEHHLDVDNPEDYYPVDEDLAYESWRDDQLTES